MTPRTPPLRIAAALLLLGSGAAGAQDDTVKRIIRGSTDGDRTYYTVSCTSGERGSIIVKHASEETCAVPRNGTPQCEKDGLLRDAAERACKPPPRG